VNEEIKALGSLSRAHLEAKAVEYRVPLELVELVSKDGKIPVPNFAAGGVATPADAALIRQLGAEAVFVGSGIFKSESPAKMAKAIVEANFNYDNPKKLLEISRGLGKAMAGLEIGQIPPGELLAGRGW
jgi:pyridoxal 5'-phosphate synthase pdxS subunit